jgi:beta-lactamase class A
MYAIALLTTMITSPKLDDKLTKVAKETVAHFSGLKADDFSISLMWGSESGSYRGDAPMYPASVVKMFYMAYAHQLLEEGKIKSNPELERAMTDMIKESNNDATGMILDTITGTTGGPALEEKELKVWMEKRNAVNRWLKSKGYEGINCNQKTWNEGPYGRERQGYGPNFELRNSLTANSCNKIMSEILSGSMVSQSRSAQMRSLLKRSSGSAEDGQSNYIGAALPHGTEIFSKAGWTSTVRHDTAAFKWKDQQIVLTIFTKAQVGRNDLIKFIADRTLALD